MAKTSTRHARRKTDGKETQCDPADTNIWGGGHFRASSTKLKFASEKLQYGGGAIRRVSLCDGAAAVV